MRAMKSAESHASALDGEVLPWEVCLGHDDDVRCFELSSEACRVLAEIVVAAQRKAGEGKTEAA
jgi:hypothetical protein